MTICSLGNDNLLSRCVYSDILNRKLPPKKPFRPENSDCAECVTFSLPRIKFNLSSGVFERRTATGSKTSSLFICLDATKTNKLSSHVCVYFREVFQHLNILVYTNFLFESVLCFATKDGWISRLLCNAAFGWRPGKLLCGLKTFWDFAI